MGARFWFFTDPAKLAAQTPGEEFGPVPGLFSNKNRFQVTDRHTAVGIAPAYAVCRGRICFQPVLGGTGQIESLNLILQPLVPPPFGFPHVEYFIYRGLDPLSVLTTALTGIELLREGVAPDGNDLIGFIRKRVLKLPAPASASSSQLLAYLGLDRTHGFTPTTGGLPFNDSEPLDHLFRYPAGAELPLVEPGWKLGEFLGGPGNVGFEVVVQHYGAQPKLSWTRQGGAWIEADALSGTSASADYQGRLQREAIGCFVDPCAFWGMFCNDKLWFPDPADAAGVGDAPTRLFTPTGMFKNRDRVYLSVRNEVGLSYDFYQSYLDAGCDLKIASTEAGLTVGATVYGVNDWPLHFLDTTPAAALWFQLGAGGNAMPLLFLQQAGSAGSPNKPFQDVLNASDPLWTQPVKFQRPALPGGSQLPPWWFVAHLLRGQDAVTGPAAAAGVFDTSPLQFGPISDSVIAAYQQLWSMPPPAGAYGHERTFISDKTLRHDGSLKVDPVDPSRTLAYDRVGDTFYVFQRGRGSDAGKDCVMIVQRRSHGRQSVPVGSWRTADADALLAVANGMLFGTLGDEVLSRPVTVPLTGGGAPPKVRSFEDLLSDNALKTEIFDYTYLLLSKVAFDLAIAQAAPASPPFVSGDKHPVFLSLKSPSNLPGVGAYDLWWSGWDGAATGSATGITVYSADGVVFSSPDYDAGSPFGARPYVQTGEEQWRASIWDDWIAKDTLGSTPVDRMPALVDAFVGELIEASAVVAANPAAKVTAFLPVVETYGSKIWNRAVQLVQSSAHLDFSDRILYCTRLKMEVALKGNPDVQSDPALKTELVDRFEALSRNFAALNFVPGDISSGAKPVLVTGFDPYGDGALSSNPSGQLALLFAATPSQSHVTSHAMALRCCIFPNRWSDFDEELVEKVIGGAIPSTSTGIKPKIVCTSSLNPNIKGWICEMGNTPNFVADIHVRIDRYATRCVREGRDNNRGAFNPQPVLGSDTDNIIYYENQLRIADLSIYDNLPINVAYDESYHFSVILTSGNIDYTNDLTAKYIISPTTPYTLRPYTFPKIGIQVHYHEMYPANHKIVSQRRVLSVPLPSTTLPLPDPSVLSPSLTVLGIRGSGGPYFSNEIHYRVCNLIQSKYSHSPNLKSKYSGITNGHIHIPNLGEYGEVDALGNRTTTPAYGSVALAEVAASVVAVLDGVLWP